MVISRRERTIIWVTGAVIGLLVVDRYFLDPSLKRSELLETELRNCESQESEANRLLLQKRRFGPQWAEITQGGLGSDAEAAEGQILHALRDWAQESGLSLSSVKHESSETMDTFQKINLRATATGSMEAVTRFVWRIENATLALRISQFQLGSRKEGTDDLSLQLGLSTLCLSTPAEKPKEPETAPPQRKEKT